jgi:hypothetical protein
MVPQSMQAKEEELLWEIADMQNARPNVRLGVKRTWP